MTFITSISKEQEPNNFVETIQKSKMVQTNARRVECIKLKRNKTYKIVPIPKNKKTLWFYKMV
jgi:hypothetical protein